MHKPGISVLSVLLRGRGKREFNKGGPDIAIPHSSRGLQAEACTQHLPSHVVQSCHLHGVVRGQTAPLHSGKKGSHSHGREAASDFLVEKEKSSLGRPSSSQTEMAGHAYQGAQGKGKELLDWDLTFTK